MTDLNDSAIAQALETLMTSYWRLSGSELTLTEQMLAPTLLWLIERAQACTPQQDAIVRVVTQGYLLADMLALHRLDFEARRQYSSLAMDYAELIDEREMYLTAWLHVAGSCYYKKAPTVMLEAYQEILRMSVDSSPYLRKRIYAGAADACALCGRPQKAMRYLGLMDELDVPPPEDTLSVLTLDCGPGAVCLWQGLTYLDLHQPRKALDLFTNLEHTPEYRHIPERIRVEIINQKARAALALRDLEHSVLYIEQGIRGALSLNSRKRYSEATEIYQDMRLVWKNDARVQSIADMFVV